MDLTVCKFLGHAATAYNFLDAQRATNILVAYLDVHKITGLYWRASFYPSSKQHKMLKKSSDWLAKDLSKKSHFVLGPNVNR